MIIVSQDKKSLINFKSVIRISTYYGKYVEIYASLYNGEDVNLGAYNTENRAIEVLNEIINSEKMAKYEMPEE